MGAWSPSLDWDVDPLTGVERVGLVCTWGTNRACVSGYPAGIHWFTNRRFCETVRLGYGLATGAYLEWLGNEVIMIANKT